MQKEVTVIDFYNASYLLLEKCELKKVEARPANGRIICEFTLTGEDISQKHLTYLNGEAVTNILNFRRMLSQIQIWAYMAKKKYKREQGQLKGKEVAL